MLSHLMYTDLATKISSDEKFENSDGQRIDLCLDVEELKRDVLPGFHLMEFWLSFIKDHKLPDCGSWYLQVDRTLARYWRLHFALSLPQTDHAEFTKIMWNAYKKYFNNTWLPKDSKKLTPSDVVPLDDPRVYEHNMQHLINVQWATLEPLVDVLSKLRPMGDVFRTPQDKECLLVCKTNDVRYMKSAERLWLPEGVLRKTMDQLWDLLQPTEDPSISLRLRTLLLC